MCGCGKRAFGRTILSNEAVPEVEIPPEWGDSHPEPGTNTHLDQIDEELLASPPDQFGRDYNPFADPNLPLNDPHLLRTALGKLGKG